MSADPKKQSARFRLKDGGQAIVVEAAKAERGTMPVFRRVDPAPGEIDNLPEFDPGKIGLIAGL